MADENMPGNLLSGMIGEIILQIKPYQRPQASNGKGAPEDAETGKSMKAEIDERTVAKMGAGMPRYDAMASATEEVHAERMGKILKRFEDSVKKEEPLPRKGAFRWLRHKGNGGEKKQVVQPPAIKK